MYVQKKVFLVLFCSRRTAYIVRDNAKKIYIGRFILQGHNIIFKNILRVRCSLRKIKKNFMVIFWSERHDNAVKKAKGSLWLLKLKVDVLYSAEKNSPSVNVAILRSFKLKQFVKYYNKKKDCKDFLVPYNINNHQLQ